MIATGFYCHRVRYNVAHIPVKGSTHARYKADHTSIKQVLTQHLNQVSQQRHRIVVPHNHRKRPNVYNVVPPNQLLRDTSKDIEEIEGYIVVEPFFRGIVIGGKIEAV